MSFSDLQLRRLRGRLKPQHIRTREANGHMLHYIEGWHAINEANRIFGFDGWDREMVFSTCVWSRQQGSKFAASYLARVKITVRADGACIIREGSGAGEAFAATPGQAHEQAAKAAETDATKRALSTFGNAFGLSLYGGAHGIEPHMKLDRPITPATREFSATAPAWPHLPQRIDRSELAVPDPKRLRNPVHLQSVASKPCVICGRRPAQAHHLTHAQPKALGRKVSDEFAVPLCALHHSELHAGGDERRWWADKAIDALAIASELWKGSQSRSSTATFSEDSPSRVPSQASP